MKFYKYIQNIKDIPNISLSFFYHYKSPIGNAVPDPNSICAEGDIFMKYHVTETV